MRKMPLLFVLLGFISGGCAYAYAARTVIECDGLRGEAWAEATFARVEESEADMRAASGVLESSTHLALETPDDLISLRQEMQPYLSRAKTRYTEQMAQIAPGCLRRMQELMADVFYHDWKMYEALHHGDTELAAERQDQWLAATDAVWQEYERLVEKYHWIK